MQNYQNAGNVLERKEVGRDEEGVLDPPAPATVFPVVAVRGKGMTLRQTSNNESLYLENYNFSIYKI